MLAALMGSYYNIFLMRSIDLDQQIEMMLMNYKAEYQKKMTDSLYELMENLEEGIVLFKNHEINFINKVF